MSVIGSTGGGYPAVNLKNVGDSVAGRIVSFEDFQVTEFADDSKRGVKKGDPKVFPSGDPIMGVRIVMEVTPGDESSRVTLWVEKVNMLKAIARAVKGTGATDLEVDGDLAVTFSGWDGRAKAFQSAYDRSESISGDATAA